MNEIMKAMSVQDALNELKEGKGYSVWMQKISSVELQDFDPALFEKTADILDARVFNEDAEYHFFRYDDELRAVKISKGNYVKLGDITASKVNALHAGMDLAEKHYFEETQKLRGKFLGYASEITLRHYLDYEDDGFAYIAGTVLCGCKKTQEVKA